MTAPMRCARAIDAIVNRAVQGQRQPNRVRADGFIVVPAHRHLGHPCQGDAGIGPPDLAQPHLAPQRIGDLGRHQARRVQLLAARRQLARGIRAGLVDQQLDRHARIDHEAHRKSSR